MKKFSMLSILFIFIAITAYADSSRIQNPSNGHWYQRFDTTMTWHEAKAYCENIGGYLATVTSQDENDFLCNNFTGGGSQQLCWLGATDEEQEGVWKWVTNEEWGYTNWACDDLTCEPNNCTGIEHYLMLYLSPQGGEKGSGLAILQIE